MAPPILHVIGIDPGYTTGWCRIAVPRKCLYGRQPNEILEFVTGEIYGPEDEQAIEIARRVVHLQGMEYKVGPAVVVEDFSIMQTNPTTNSELLSPVRIAAKLMLLRRLKMMGDARVILQGRGDPKHVYSDERLKMHGYYVEGPDHIRDATRQALFALRRAAKDDDFRDEMWDRSICLL